MKVNFVELRDVQFVQTIVLFPFLLHKICNIK